MKEHSSHPIRGGPTVRTCVLSMMLAFTAAGLTVTGIPLRRPVPRTE